MRCLATATAAAVLAGAAWGAPPAAPVPPTQEIEVLDPGVGSGPASPVVAGPGRAGGTAIDLPPAVLAHRYYYTGDRSFQAQLLPGGPVIAVVSHPQTLERVYVPLTLPPGAPRVTYTAKSIRYDYGPQSVTLTFGHSGRPAVAYSQATGPGYRATTGLTNTLAGARDLVQRTGLPDGVRALGQGARGVLEAGADAVGGAGRKAAELVRSGGQAVPGLRQLTPAAAAERAAAKAADTGFRLPDAADPRLDKFRPKD